MSLKLLILSDDLPTSLNDEVLFIIHIHFKLCVWRAERFRGQ